jgi:hypothetical protein
LVKSYVECLDLLAERTEGIHAIVRTGDWDSLLGALKERQALIDQIDALPMEARELETEALAEASWILERVDAEDRQMLEKLQAAVVSIREDLEASDRVRTSVAAYGRSLSPSTQIPTARFVDKQK